MEKSRALNLADILTAYANGRIIQKKLRNAWIDLEHLSGEDLKQFMLKIDNEYMELRIKPTIHIVHILDGSGSMNWERPSKFDMAREGMESEIAILKKDNTVNYLYTIVEFDYPNHIVKVVDRVPINENTKYSDFKLFTPEGNTALYDAIGTTLHDLFARTEDEKVLIKIFTDGAENSSREYNSVTLSLLIDKAKEKGYVVTFIGTLLDVKMIQYKLRIEASNTLQFDGTTRGMKAAYQTANNATIMYSKAVVDGLDSNVGFFNEQNTKK